MKKLLLILFASLFSMLSFAQIIVSGEITSNTTWSNDNIYLLDGWVYVRNGATLTIEPGTLIKGDFATKGALIVERGGRLVADGTAEQPIVFTSQRAAGSRAYGDWGGVIICGRASINAPENAGNGTAAGEAIIEGGVGSVYGGGANPDDNDDSGILRYVRIEYGGIPFQPNSEINGLTMGGVGRGTTIDHVQVSYCGDDAFEWFGGTVNCTNLISYNNWDDDFDTDFGYRGNIQFGLIVRDPNIADQSGSNGFESDNDGQGTGNTPITRPVFSNITVIGPLAFSSSINSNYKRALHLRRNTKTSVYNSVFVGYPTGLLIDGSATQANAANNELRFSHSILCQMSDTLATNTNANPNNVSGSFDITSWYGNSSWYNGMIYNASELLFANLSNNHPDLTLLDGSPLASGADFSDSDLTNDFFNAVGFRGAFDSENWTACWAEWDPQNAAYTSAANYSITASIEASGNTTVCPGESVQLNALTNGVSPTFAWSTGESAASITISNPASISLVVTDNRGCTASAEPMSIENYSAPQVTISALGQTSFCTGGSVSIQASQNNNLVWNTGEENSTIEVSESGSYQVVYTDENGCEAVSNTISVSVSDSPAPTISTSGELEICEGEDLQLTASSSDSYQWNLNGNALPNETGQTILAQSSGAYTVTVTNSDQCNGTGTSAIVYVTVQPTPDASFEFETTFNSGLYEFSNTTTNATSYFWDFGDGSTSTAVNPEHQFANGGSNTVTLTATNGSCSDVYTFTIGDVQVVESEFAALISLYPNPASEDAVLSIQSENASPVVVSVYDLNGKLLVQTYNSKLPGTSIINIPAAGFAAGIYPIHIRMNENLTVLKLVKH